MAKDRVRELTEEDSDEKEEYTSRYDFAPPGDYNVAELGADKETADWESDPEPRARRPRSSAIR